MYIRVIWDVIKILFNNLLKTYMASDVNHHFRSLSILITLLQSKYVNSSSVTKVSILYRAFTKEILQYCVSNNDIDSSIIIAKAVFKYPIRFNYLNNNYDSIFNQLISNGFSQRMILSTSSFYYVLRDNGWNSTLGGLGPVLQMRAMLVAKGQERLVIERQLMVFILHKLYL